MQRIRDPGCSLTMLTLEPPPSATAHPTPLISLLSTILVPRSATVDIVFQWAAYSIFPGVSKLLPLCNWNRRDLTRLVMAPLSTYLAKVAGVAQRTRSCLRITQVI